ncbi:MAG: hypothetical protein JSU88_09865 [Nitrospinaceae bacterium]|nr:MAG: hypothetical protein JSU88_09865 [Nitrospinaceae bacterium]
MTCSTARPGGRSLCFSLRLLGGFLAVVLLFGCASDAYYQEVEVPPAEMHAYLDDKPPSLHPYYERVLRQGRRNLVLSQMEAGLAAMEYGAYDLAEESFETALLNIETVYTDDESARRARLLWYAEGAKDFKGEPYERAMAYYYRGLLFLRRGDYENARASFKGGQLQDTLAEEARYRMDFALLVYLEGWASHLLGDDDLAREAFEEVRQIRPDFVPPERGDNVLLLAETGHGPVKIGTGAGDAELRLVRGSGFTEQSARFDISGAGLLPAYTMEDVYWQASTRGGRQVDAILQGKVRFKETHQAMGRALTDVSVQGLLMAPAFGKNADKAAIAAGIVGILGLTQQAVAGATRTEADTRTWRSLPDRVHVLTFQAEPRALDVGVLFYDSRGVELGNLKKWVKVDFVNRRSGFAWVRSRTAFIE